MALNFRHDFVLSAIAADFEGGDLSSVFEDRLVSCTIGSLNFGLGAGHGS